MALTMVAIKAAVGRDKAYKLTDSDGLHLLVLPSGGRYWRMHYRYLGKQKSLAFGVWPDVGLAEARSKRDVARRLLAAANTFGAVADEWLAAKRPENCASPKDRPSRPAKNQVAEPSA